MIHQSHRSNPLRYSTAISAAHRNVAERRLDGPTENGGVAPKPTAITEFQESHYAVAVLRLVENCQNER